MGWKQAARHLTLGALFAANTVGCFHTTSRDARNQEKAQFRQTLSERYHASALQSQAVFILPPPLANDPQDSKQAAYDLVDEFIKQGVPCFMIGDTAGATTFDIDQRIREINAEYNFNAITVLVLTHGAPDRRAKGNDSVDVHKTALGKTDLDTDMLMRSFTMGTLAQKVDWVTISCYGGLVSQYEIDNLPTGSAFISFCGKNQFGRLGVIERLRDGMRDKSIDFSTGCNATDFIVEILSENVRHYNGTLVFGIAKKSMTTVSSDNAWKDDANYTNKDTKQLKELAQGPR